MTPSYDLAIGFSTSGAEELQKLLPRARVVKAFNTVFAETMKTGQMHGEKLTIFVAGDDAGSKDVVRKLAEDIGFDSSGYRIAEVCALPAGRPAGYR